MTNKNRNISKNNKEKTVLKKKMSAFVCVFLGLVAAVGAGTMDGVTLNNKNKKQAAVTVFQENTEVKSVWDKGVVVRLSDDEKNDSGFGKFVEIKYDLGFDFGGRQLSYAMVRVIYFNIENTPLKAGNNVSKGDVVAVSKKGPDEALKAFLISDTDDIVSVKLWTNDKKKKIGDLWYWDAGFLFGKRS